MIVIAHENYRSQKIIHRYFLLNMISETSIASNSNMILRIVILLHLDRIWYFSELRDIALELKIVVIHLFKLIL